MIEKIINLLLTTNITIEKIEEITSFLEALEHDDARLSYLEAYGVDNWEGYSEAMYEFYNGEED